jgi:N-acetyl-1-D-myo-inositol-2-amino-2-deoxy-alpha-D-glucopyranoside deacetylase
MTPRIDANTRLLVLAPHPDDETIGAGALIQQVRQAGGEVRIVLFTNGDNNPWPQRYLERRWWIDASARQRWGRRRRAEVSEALDRLGVPSEALTALNWPDMGLTGLLRQWGVAAVDEVAAQIANARPNVIVLPSLDDDHPDHGSCHVLARLALAKLGIDCPLLAYLIHGKDRGRSHEHWTVPVEAALTTRKLYALQAHVSQTVLSGARVRRFASRPESYQLLDAAPCIEPAWRPPRALWPCLRVTLAEVDRVQSWPWAQSPLRSGSAGEPAFAPSEPGSPRFAKLELVLPSPWIFDHWGWRSL